IDDNFGSLLRGVTGLTSVLIGLTVVAQVPRLSRVWKARFGSVVLFLVLTAGYPIVPNDVRSRLGCFLGNLVTGRGGDAPLSARTWPVIGLTLLIGAIVYVTGRFKPRAGLKTLLWLAIAGLTITVGVGLDPDSPCTLIQSAGEHRLWPLILATGVF